MRVLTRLLLFTALLLAAAPRPVLAQSDLLGRVNALRASVGRAPYTLNSALSAAAQDQAQWMASTGSVSHTRPDGSGPRTRAAAYGYPSAQVSENIYGGTNASADSAWNFWVNSGVHYAGMVNPNYNEIGIGSASGSWGSTFVLVFGNSGGPSLAAVSASSGGAAGGAAGPPSYVVGSDEYGNIMHEVQPGDTLGDIALIYGYTWGDLPAMMALNEIIDVRDLEVGSVFLVPPKAGTYTPVPTTPPPTLTPTPVPPTLTPYVALRPVNAATIQVTPLAALTQPPTAPAAGIATAAAAPAWLETVSPSPEATQTPTVTAESAAGAVAVALAPTGEPLVAAAVLPPTPENNTNTLLIVAILVQVGVIGAAAISFLRGGRKARRP
jgi:hypothetical protein